MTKLQIRERRTAINNTEKNSLFVDKRSIYSLRPILYTMLQRQCTRTCHVSFMCLPDQQTRSQFQRSTYTNRILLYILSQKQFILRLFSCFMHYIYITARNTLTFLRHIDVFAEGSWKDLNYLIGGNFGTKLQHKPTAIMLGSDQRFHRC